MSPHGDLCGNVDELELDRHGLEVHAGLCAIHSDLEKGVIEALAVGIVVADSSELLVGGVVRRGDIVGEEPGVGHKMAETDNITDMNAVASLFRDGASSRDNLPEVVGVIVGISGDLLTLGRDTAVVVTKRVSVGMTVEVDLCVLVTDVDGVVVVDADGLLGHDVVAESLLELGAHEVVTGTGAVEDGEMDLEPEEVEHERDDDQTSDTSTQVLAELGQTESALSTVDVEKRPEVNGDGDADGEEGEGTDVLCRDDAAEADTSQEQPLPPLAAEGDVAELVEADVAPDGQSHEENEGGVEKNESCLANMGVVEEHKASSQDTGGQRVARLPHDHENGRDGQSTHRGRHCAVRNVGDLVCDVRVANVLKQKLAIVADQPACEREQELAKRRVHIEEVGSLEIVGCELSEVSDWCHGRVSCSGLYLAKVDFIKDDLVGVGDGVEASCESEEGDDGESELVVPVVRCRLLGLVLQLVEVFGCLVGSNIDLLFGASRRPLLGARRRRHGERSIGIRDVIEHLLHTGLIDSDVEG